jgi:phytoene synthase
VPDASEITRRAKSNLAFALRILPPERRADMEVFYAFCRSMDDLADDPGIPAAERAASLDAWKLGLGSGFETPTTFQAQVVEMRDRRGIPNRLLVDVIDGCRMDLQPLRFQTWDELDAYIWKVACAVGLVSIRLFGCEDAASETYAVALGRALQLTNILRDIGEDLGNGPRVYLPLEDLARFGYSEDDLLGRIHDGRFLQLMTFEADRAEEFFREAAAVLPEGDRRALTAARIMGEIYHRLLELMRRDGFRVFDRRYSVSRARKLAILSKHLVAG